MENICFIGCPVLTTFLEILDANVVQSDADAWDDVKAKAFNERPDVDHYRACSILSIAFGLEEVAFALVRTGLSEEARTVRNVPKPILAAKDLNPILEPLSELHDAITAHNVQFKFLGEDLTSEQIRKEKIEALHKAMSILLPDIVLLRDNWDEPHKAESLRPGRSLASVCSLLTTPHSRRLAYARGLLGDHRHVRQE